MAKKVSMKQQIYQQIANKQVEQVLNQQREQQNAELMADFDNFMKQQQNPEALMADFNSWKQQNAAPQPRQSIPSIADTQPKRDLQAEAREYFANVRKERAAEEAEAKRVKEQQLKATINDYARQQQEENMLASNSASKKKELKVGKRPEATDFSSQVAARPVDRETLKGGKKWNESVNNTLNMLNNTRPMPVMGNDLVENEPIIPENYTRPETQEDMVNRWLSPDTKLTDDEKKAAKEYASAELQKVQYGPNKMPLFENEEQRQHYADMVNLINKTNGFTNFMSGAIEVPYNLADMVSDGARSVGNQLGGLGAAITDKLGVTEGATQRHNEQAEIANHFADQNEANMRQSFKNANTQNPGAYTAGKIAGQTGMYMLTNPVFDGIAAGAGVESELAKFFINQGAQNVQDLVLDTAPTVRQLMEDGSTPEEVKREALNNILWNVAGNAVMGGLGAWAGNRAARKASDEAFRENVRAGADNLSRIANEIPGIEDADNVVRNATRQAETAAQNIENLNKQIPNLPDYVTGGPTGGYDVSSAVNPDDVVYHSGILSKLNKAETRGKMSEGSRNTGYYGTGHYFVDGKHKAELDNNSTYSKQPYSSVDISKYNNLYKTATDEQASDLHDFAQRYTRYVNGYNDRYFTDAEGVDEALKAEYLDELYDQFRRLFPEQSMSKDSFVDRLEAFRKDERDIDLMNRDDSVFTQFMKEMGYNGVDTRGTRSADTSRGVVIYDLDEDSILQSNVKTDDVKKGLMNTRVRNENEPIFDATEDARIQKLLDQQRNKAAILSEYHRLYDDTALQEAQVKYEEIDAQLKNLEENARPYYSRLVSDEKFLDKTVNDFLKEFEEFGITEDFNVEKANKLADAKESLIEVDEKIAELKQQLAEAKANLDEQDNLSIAAYKQAQQNVNSKKDAISNEAERAINQPRTMAESISKPKSDIITSEPIEPGKYEIPDTPENAPIDVPPVDGMKERGTSKHIRNAGTPMKMEDVADEVVADFEKDPDMYKVLRNADTKAKAEQIYNTSDNPEAEFRSLLEKKDPAALPLGHQLAKDYSDAGNHDAAAQIYRDMGKALTESGQFSQAAIINMVKNDPMTALQYAQKEIDSLNDVGRKRFGNRWKDFELTQQELDAFKGIKAGDADAIKAIYENIGNRLGKEYPTTLWDKIIEARRVAMLFNPRTNVRNLGANPPTLAMRWLSDRVEAVGQNIAHLINPDIKVTQSLTGSGIRGRKIASEVYDSNVVKSMLNNSGSKSDLPELKNSVMQHKQVFKGTALEKWIDRVTGGGIQKLNQKLFDINGVQSIPETVRNATYKLLDLGDRPFVKENFVERLGSYINATGIKSADDVPEEAIQMAWEEAMKATYKDNSWAVDMLRNIKKGVEKADNVVPGLGTTISQSAIPFVQAPGNIAARMVDYSPVGAGKGIAKIIKGARANDVKAVTKGIEEASKGLTGTGLIYLGMKLRESGLVTGTYSENKRQKAFEKQNGFKEFALHVGDKYFTYGWAQPAAQTIMVGSLLQDAIEKSDEYDSDMLNYFGIENSKAGKGIGVVKAGTRAAVNSWFNESPLSGLADFLKGNSYSDTDIAGNLWENGVQDFAGALVPSVVNATAKVVDTTQRNAYDPSNTFGTFVNSNIAKIPGLSKTLPAKYDTWGREMKYAETKGAAAAARYAIPGEYSYDRSDKIDNEINRLFSEAKDEKGQLIQDSGVFPTVAPNAVGDKKLNNKEVSEYQKDMGTRSRTAVETFMASDAYKSMGDPEKIEAIKKIYGASNAITKRDKFDYPLADNSEYKKAVAVYDKAGGGEKGAKALAEFYSNRAFAEQSGLSASSKAFQDIENDLAEGNTEAAQQKVDAAQRLPELGLDMPGPAATYNKAVGVIPGITVDDFAKTYKAMDADHNQALKKVEVIDYMNSKNMGQSEGMRFWKAYAKTEGERPWKIPSLNDGTWK